MLLQPRGTSVNGERGEHDSHRMPNGYGYTVRPFRAAPATRQVTPRAAAGCWNQQEFPVTISSVTVRFIGSGPYCYANSLAMMLGSAAPEPAVIEVLTGLRSVRDSSAA